jgi:hypothetical protein
MGPKLTRTNCPPDQERYNLIYTAPASYVAVTKDAVFEAGGGVYEGGKYKQVSPTYSKLENGCKTLNISRSHTSSLGVGSGYQEIMQGQTRAQLASWKQWKKSGSKSCAQG